MQVNEDQEKAASVAERNTRRMELKPSGYFYTHFYIPTLLLSVGKSEKKRGEMNMKNDIRKANEITIEMRVNDIVYGIISGELDDMICDCDNLSEEFEKLYFAKRVLSVLENSDMPIRAAVGLLDNVFIVDALFEDKDEYIGESDTDTDIYNFVVEHGYRHYDEIVMPGELPETVFIRMARCMMKKGGFNYDE